MSFHNFIYLFIFFIAIFNHGCAFKKNILFQIPKDWKDIEEGSKDFQKEIFQTRLKNYKISKFDKIVISVFTNKGEILIDPNKEFRIGGVKSPEDIPSMNPLPMVEIDEIIDAQTQNAIRANSAMPSYYSVNEEGMLTLPLIDKIYVEGFTTYELDSILAKKYNSYYINPFVKTEIINKKVFLMGALGDRIIPIKSDAMTLFDILLTMNSTHSNQKLSTLQDIYQLQGLHTRSKNKKIRIIRLIDSKYKMQIIDLTSLEGLQQANIIIHPNDIIYVEPRKSSVDRDIYTEIQKIIASISSALAVYLLIISTTR